MDCQERLLSQAKMVKALGTPTKVMVYKNLVKALPWYTDVRAKITNPAYSDWFLKFKDGVTGTDYHVPACTGKGTPDDPKKCSAFYHDPKTKRLNIHTGMGAAQMLVTAGGAALRGVPLGPCTATLHYETGSSMNTSWEKPTGWETRLWMAFKPLRARCLVVAEGRLLFCRP